MTELGVSILVSKILIFIFVNYLFINATFVKNKADFSLEGIRVIYALVLTVVFVRFGISFIGILAYFSLLGIYTLRISEMARKRMPKAVIISHSHEPYYYMSLYWTYFLAPSAKLMVSLLPAVGLLFLVSRV